MSAIARNLASRELWNSVIAASNRRLVKHSVQVRLADFLTPPQAASRGYQLLEMSHLVQQNSPLKKSEFIDIFTVSISTSKAILASLLVHKVVEHLEAKETQGILISPYGRKLDIRTLLSSPYLLEMTKYGDLILNRKFVHLNFVSCCVTEEDRNPISSCTIARAIPWQDSICILDDADLASNFEDPFPVIKKGVIKLSTPEQVDKDQKTYFERVFRVLFRPRADVFDIVNSIKLMSLK